MPPALRMPRWEATICQLSCDMATATTWSGPVRKGERAAATLSARASSSAKVRDSPVWGICKAVKCGNFSAERLKTSVSHRIPF